MTAPNDEIVCKELVELVTPYLEGVLPANGLQKNHASDQRAEQHRDNRHHKRGPGG